MRRCHLPLLLLAYAAGACAAPGQHAGEATYAGSAACAECHADAARVVAGGVHARAMQPATDSTVSGDFTAPPFDHFGDVSEFLRRDGKPRVRTVGADGERREYEITHVIGVRPLEQYLVALPGGRWQVLPLAWDTRPAGAGGGRWFHMHPGERIAADDELHWTGPLQTWNYMCAECHVTGLQRNYDVAANTYATSWRELGVQCEACHGPGSLHIAWARDSAGARSSESTTARGLLVDLSTRGGDWVYRSGAAIAQRTERPGTNAQVETCAACHARRETLVAAYVPGRPLLATHRPVLLDEGLYHADGQLLDEVYEYGSFLQSRMYRAGVTCSDCHDPSTQQVAPGNAACGKCHDGRVYDATSHHFHQAGSTGASCVNCHMPPRTYMVVDPRHDHSLRVPRPDLSLRIGTPNACTACHADRSNEWAARAAERWWGAPTPTRHYGDVIAAGRRGDPSADTGLIRLAFDTTEAGIVRATAVSLLERSASPAVAAAIARAARDAEPLVRLAAAMTSHVLPSHDRLRATSHLMTDSLLAIRVEAARLLAEIPDQLLTAQQRLAFDDFVAAQRVNADRPESHLRLGVLALQRGRPDDAERHYGDAIRIAPRYVGGYINLADLYRAQGREADAERVLRDGLRTVHRPGALHHALGLLLVRTRRHADALPQLAKAVELEPDVPRFATVYAVALHAAGRGAEAVRILEHARRRAPSDRELAETLASIRR